MQQLPLCKGPQAGRLTCTQPTRLQALRSRHAGRYITRSTQPESAGFTAADVESMPNIIVPEALKEAQGQQQARSMEPPPGYTTVPISELPRPNAKAQRRLQSALNKTGVYKALVDTLNSVSFTIVGDDADLSWAVAQALSERIGWFPVCTAKVLTGMHKVEGGSTPSSMQAALLQHFGGSQEKLAEEELGVLRGIRTQKRVIVSTMSGGAAASKDSYIEMWGSFLVWADEEDKGAPKARTPQRTVYGQCAEVKAIYQKTRGFSALKATTQDKARELVDALLRQLVTYLNAQADVVDRKIRYVAYGCRGDWPEVKPHEEAPALLGFERDTAPKAVQAETGPAAVAAK